MSKQTLRILLIEDDNDDVEFFTHGLKAASVEYTLEVLMEGDSVESYVEAIHNEIPDLIVLDLHLPNLHGREVLKYIKKSSMRHVPVVVWSSSTAEHDRQFVHEHGAKKFISKPSGPADMRKTAEELLSVVR